MLTPVCAAIDTLSKNSVRWLAAALPSRGLGPAAFIGRCRVVPLRNTGAALAPFNAFLIMQGLETLALRMERHCENEGMRA